jgi:glycosyltransferase involved in cell wall biosynthesis
VKPRILAVADWYIPATKAGGMVTALRNLISLLHEDFEFWVLTRNHDVGVKQSLVGVPSNTWVRQKHVEVKYLSNVGTANLRKHVLELAPDIMYLNSYFSVMTVRLLALRRLHLLPRIPVVLAPRGEFSPGALELKSAPKRIYRQLARRSGLHEGLIWQAGSQEEIQDIRCARVISEEARPSPVVLSDDPPSADLLEPVLNVTRAEKIRGQAKFLFLSRISRKKNLHAAIQLLAQLRGKAELSIIGPIEDATYWQECQSIIRLLPSNVQVHYGGVIAQEDARGQFMQHQFLLLPTLGENFGYVILEALSSGCLAVISDTTPWRNLESHRVGWDIPLQDTSKWIHALQYCIDMNVSEYNQRSQLAVDYINEWINSTPYLARAKELFNTALAMGRCPVQTRPPFSKRTGQFESNEKR